MRSRRRRLAELTGPADGAGLQALEAVHDLLTDLVAVMEDLTPLKRFPVQRAAEAHGAWHLLRACRRAAAAHLDQARQGQAS
jgi:hypothetical protein